MTLISHLAAGEWLNVGAPALGFARPVTWRPWAFRPSRHRARCPASATGGGPRGRCKARPVDVRCPTSLDRSVPPLGPRASRVVRSPPLLSQGCIVGSTVAGPNDRPVVDSRCARFPTARVQAAGHGKAPEAFCQKVWAGQTRSGLAKRGVCALNECVAAMASGDEMRCTNCQFENPAAPGSARSVGKDLR